MNIRKFPPLFLANAFSAPPEGVIPVAGFEAERYLGTWFEIARLDNIFERGLTRVTATYGQNPDGSMSILNRGFDARSGAWKEARGTARFRKAADVGSLAVTFFRPFSGGYHIFALDRENYTWAAVSGPSRKYLWLLSRTREMPEDIRRQLVARAKKLGFPVDRLLMTDQSPEALP